MLNLQESKMKALRKCYLMFDFAKVRQGLPIPFFKYKIDYKVFSILLQNDYTFVNKKLQGL